jgi:hypothetical protein
MKSPKTGHLSGRKIVPNFFDVLGVTPVLGRTVVRP